MSASSGIPPEVENLAQAAARAIRLQSGVANHDVAVILGSGWSGASQKLGQTNLELPAEVVPGFFPSGMAGHSGMIQSIVTRNGKHVLVIGARTHLYEGRGPSSVVHPVRMAAACGAKIMILTNGAGGIKSSWVPGQPVLISDHINLTSASPLVGTQFIDLTDLYSERLRRLAKEVNPTLDEGVYVQFRGPQYETPAEVQMARSIGGDIVGMSTALEAIAARQAGMEVLGLSLITNLAAGISPHPLSHQEVVDAGRAAEPVIVNLLSSILELL